MIAAIEPAAEPETQTAAETDAELQQIFAARARRLAQPLARTAGDFTEQQALVILSAGERFAIDSHCVIEVHPAGRIVPVPGTPEIWRGLVNLRGRLYPVLDIGRLLAQLQLRSPEETARAPARLVLARAADLTVALCVDEVQSVRTLERGALLPPVVDASEGAPVLGMTDDLVVLLDLAALLRQVSRP